VDHVPEPDGNGRPSGEAESTDFDHVVGKMIEQILQIVFGQSPASETTDAGGDCGAGRSNPRSPDCATFARRNVELSV
jgi:hypothetical protein